MNWKKERKLRQNQMKVLEDKRKELVEIEENSIWLNTVFVT